MPGLNRAQNFRTWSMAKTKRSRIRMSLSAGAGSGKAGGWFRRTVDICLVSSATAAIIYVVAVAGRVAGGYSVEQPAPRYVVRLQVMDAREEGVRTPGASDCLGAVSDRDLVVEVVESAVFHLRSVERSFVISRQKDPAAARFLAARLGLQPGEVLGADGISAVTAGSQQEEN